MPGKKLLWLVLAMGLVSSNGCCGMWDRWCNPQPRCYQPPPVQAPCGCPVPQPQACPPGSYYPPQPTQVQAVPPAQPQWQSPPLQQR